MMRPLRLEIRNFRGWREGSVALDRQVTLVVGENRRGKSSTLNAIEWCLFGREVEKKASGIAERADWEVERRESDGGFVEVAFSLEVGGGTAKITRRRKTGAGAREEDDLAVELTDGRRLVQAEALAWMREQKLPDWETWRRACCQHQEILRSRLTVADDRSLIVSSLLGLDEYDRLHRILKDQQPGKLIGELDRVLADLENVVLYRLRAPSEELFESERRLEALGIERARLSPALPIEIGRGAIERARALAERLGLAAALPACESEADEPELRKWADGWAALVRKESKTGERLASATKRRAKLAAEIEQLEPSEERWRKAKERLDAEQREKGDEATQKTLLSEAEKKVSEAEAGLRAENRTLALLRETLEVLRGSPDKDQCPVCDTRVSGLAGRLEATVRKGTGEHLAALSSERDRARERRDALEKTIRGGEKLVAEEKEARKSIEGRRGSLAALVSPGRLDGGADLLAAARAEDEALATEIGGLQTAVSSLDAEIEEHRKDAERLREMAKWRAAAKRAQQRGDLTGSPEWKTFQEAVDAAAALAADLDVLGTMAREAQEKCSESREVEVNRALGGYCALIAGEEAGLDVRVKVKRTPKGLTYDIEDAGGGRALSILNQASLNAISLALLFAQAEERAKAGVPTIVVLDDPDQSLDEEHQAGLARAIERVAKSCPVIVGTTPGRFAERLMSHVSVPRRAVRLAPRDVKIGVRVESQEER
jgi:exonuclease SbcC